MTPQEQSAEPHLFGEDGDSEIATTIQAAICRYTASTRRYPKEIWLGVQANAEFEKYVESIPKVSLRVTDLTDTRRRAWGCDVLRSLEAGVRVGETMP